MRYDPATCVRGALRADRAGIGDGGRPRRTQAPLRGRGTLPTALLLIAFSVSAPDASERWAELEHQVDTSGFPVAFVDSLASACGVTRGGPLRSVASRLPVGREKVVLDATWGPIHAGYGILSSYPDSVTGHVIVSVKVVTNRFTSALMKVRDFVKTTIDPVGLYPLFFEEHIEEGRYVHQRWALFDHERDLVFSERAQHPQDTVPPFALDYLSVLWYVRSQSLQPGDTFTLETYVQGKVYPVHVTCGDREHVRTPAGEFDCIEVEPTLVGTGRISRRDRIRLWLTDDNRHMLVKIWSKITVGAVEAELVHFERDDDSTAGAPGGL